MAKTKTLKTKTVVFPADLRIHCEPFMSDDKKTFDRIYPNNEVGKPALLANRLPQKKMWKWLRLADNNAVLETAVVEGVEFK